MKPDDFRAFLHELQQKPYEWPDRYFAWEKPDGTLLMISTQTTQLQEVEVYEIDAWSESIRSKYVKEGLTKAEDAQNRLYGVCSVGINPKVKYAIGSVSFDPVEKLIDKISPCKYLGSWDNPQHFRRDVHGGGQVINRGRWAEALQNIRQQEKKPQLSATIASADLRAKTDHRASKIRSDEELAH